MGDSGHFDFSLSLSVDFSLEFSRGGVGLGGGNSIARFALPQKDFAVALSASSSASVLTVPSQRCGMAEKTGICAPQIARRKPMADKGNDPVALWQKMIGEMEKGFNAFANQTMSSPEFSRAMNQAGNVSAGAQKQFGELMEKYLLNMNLPSRAQMIGMAERLQNIEGQLGEIKAMLQQMNAGASPGSYQGAPRPPRTRRPPAPPSGETT
jgi:hypothetical protein